MHTHTHTDSHKHFHKNRKTRNNHTHTSTHQSPQRHPLSTHTHKESTIAHTNAAHLTDSSAALIADLNRPGDLSLSLTHTRHTSFFHPFPPFSLLLFFPETSLAFSQCHFTLACSCPSPLPYYLYQKCLGLIRTPQHRCHSTVCCMFKAVARWSTTYLNTCPCSHAYNEDILGSSRESQT